MIYYYQTFSVVKQPYFLTLYKLQPLNLFTAYTAHIVGLVSPTPCNKFSLLPYYLNCPEIHLLPIPEFMTFQTQIAEVANTSGILCWLLFHYFKHNSWTASKVLTTKLLGYLTSNQKVSSWTICYGCFCFTASMNCRGKTKKKTLSFSLDV